MNRLYTGALCLALTVGIGACGSGESESVSSMETADEAVCASLAGNARTVCLEEAKGRAKVAEAQRRLNDSPTAEHRYQLLLAKADADFAVASARCNDLSGNPKTVCVTEAERDHAVAEADAALAVQIADARATARRASADANAQADDEMGAARAAAAHAKHDAEYAVAKEKCQVFAGDAKADCLDEAEAYFAEREDDGAHR